MKSYLEIKVPIKKDAAWLNDLKRQFKDLPVRWQNGYYHITMAFLNDATEEMLDRARQVMDDRLKNVEPMPMAFDKVDAFTVSSGDMHIINITSTVPNESFMRLAKAIRDDLTAAGLSMDSDFILHVTLGRVLPKVIPIEALRARLSSFSAPAFTLQLDSLEYLIFRERTTIGKWLLGH